MQNIGVLTGDVVGSQRIQQKERLSRALEDALALVATRFGARGDRYRGDGFQIALPKPGDAIVAAVLVRAALMQQSPSRQLMWDARIAVAVGPAQMPTAEHFAEADGEAFLLSGRSLDALNGKADRLTVVTPSAALNSELALLTRFADDVLNHWSRFSAEVAYLSLLHDESQQALAKRLERTQPTVNRRLVAARWPLVREYLAHVGTRLTEGLA